MDISSKKIGIGREEFRAALSRFPSGVTVVTTRDAEGRLHGITVSAFCSVSLEPPMILVCIEKTTGTHYAFQESEFFVVNMLAEGQEKLSNRFASQVTDKFDAVDYRLGIGEIPVLTDALVTLECRLADAYEGGDHTIFVGLIEKSEIKDEKPLIYWHGNYRKLAEID
ncbi:MAG TPA: flavin reductase family protein [Pyrinomonadaceae bacterium]|jgi:flavin reductase (DIM6/NTAB) family NADH-FMN oxidoreductase RutF